MWTASGTRDRKRCGPRLRRSLRSSPTRTGATPGTWSAGDRGVSEWTFTGTRSDGTRVEVNGCDLLTFRDGKIAVKNAFRKTIDQLSVGYALPPSVRREQARVFMKQLPDATVNDFKGKFRGDVLLPGDAGYDEARRCGTP